MKALDTVFKLTAILLSMIFLAGFSAFARRLGAFEGLLMVSNVVLMLAFVFTRYGRSLPQLSLFGVAFALVLIDFIIRAWPSMAKEGFPGDVLGIYVVEYSVIAWFGIRHWLLRRRDNSASMTE